MPQRLFDLLLKDRHVVQVLETVRDYGPPDAFVAAGFVRNRFWDSLYEDSRIFADADIDVVYFEADSPDKNHDVQYETVLEAKMPTGIWQVRNQARMHHFNGHAPFESLGHALCHWAETATTVGVCLNPAGGMEVIAPFGLDDLYDHILRITPVMRRTDPHGFKKRVRQKGWQERWPRLRIVD